MLYMHRHVRAAQIGLQVGAALYAGIVGYHVAFVVCLHV